MPRDLGIPGEEFQPFDRLGSGYFSMEEHIHGYAIMTQCLQHVAANHVQGRLVDHAIVKTRVVGPNGDILRPAQQQNRKDQNLQVPIDNPILLYTTRYTE